MVIMKRQSNKKLHPEAWEFFVEQARNITEEEDLNHLGNYSIPVPDMSGNFIYTDTVEQLWIRFIQAWYRPSLNSHSVRGKIQYIAINFRG